MAIKDLPKDAHSELEHLHEKHLAGTLTEGEKLRYEELQRRHTEGASAAIAEIVKQAMPDTSSIRIGWTCGTFNMDLMVPWQLVAEDPAEVQERVREATRLGWAMVKAGNGNAPA